jgi:hypothetical protein
VTRAARAAGCGKLYRPPHIPFRPAPADQGTSSWRRLFGWPRAIASRVAARIALAGWTRSTDPDCAEGKEGCSGSETVWGGCGGSCGSAPGSRAVRRRRSLQPRQRSGSPSMRSGSSRRAFPPARALWFLIGFSRQPWGQDRNQDSVTNKQEGTFMDLPVLLYAKLQSQNVRGRHLTAPGNAHIV